MKTEQEIKDKLKEEKSYLKKLEKESQLRVNDYFEDEENSYNIAESRISILEWILK